MLIFNQIKFFFFLIAIGLNCGYSNKIYTTDNPSKDSTGNLLEIPDSSSGQVKAVVINIEKEIDPGLASFIKRAVSEAKAVSPDMIIFQVNTFGGRLDAAFDIVDIISDIKDCSTYTFVKHKAISAGALIFLACNRIVMGEGTTIGDCAPIIQGKEGIIMAGEKIESPLRAKFRNLAEKNNYPLLLSQAMVSIDMHIMQFKKEGQYVYLTKQNWEELSSRKKKLYTGKKTVVPKGELLTMTDTEAEEYGFSLGSFGSFEDFIESRKIKIVETKSTNWSEELVRTIGKFAPILMLLGFGALYMEMKSPGFGVFGITGIILLLIVFGSKYMSGLADHVELILLFGGVALFIVEIFLLPGTFMFGTAGVGLIMVSLILSFQSFTIPDPSLPWQKDIMLGNILYVLVVALGGLLVPFLGTKYILPHLPDQMKVIADETLKDAKTPSIREIHPEIIPGTRGTTKSMLRPFGKVEILQRRYEAAAMSGYIDKDKEVEVLSVEGNKITVKEIT